jgi:chemotaxis protein MotB
MIKPKKTDINPSGWMTTFGDLIMLLLTFFVLLLTMKAMNKKVTEEMFQHFITKDEVITENIVYGPGAISTPTGIVNSKRTFISSSAILKKTLKNDYSNFRKVAGVRETSAGVLITMDSENLFASGSAKLSPSGIISLNTVGHLLEKVSNDIIIMGHTDNIRISGNKYSSNWELSCHRALSVLNYYTNKFGIEKKTIAAGGFGESKPIAPNNNTQNRAKNRRVEILLKN